jgi:endonuclease YncB( thermonuclease family)
MSRRTSRLSTGLTAAITLAVSFLLLGCQAAASGPVSSGNPVKPTPPATTRPALPTAPPTSNASPTPARTEGPTGPTEIARVVHVTDGDTIRVEIAGAEYRLRYIGVNTPETVDPRRPVEWMGHEASQANTDLVGGKEVVLEKDVSEVDRYDRLLRYVWLRDGDGWLMANEELVRRGYAEVSTYPPDVKYVDRFLVAQNEARHAGVGLWGTPQQPEPNPEQTPPSNGSASGCDPSYPDVCIAPSPPDLDCGDIPFRRFTVLPPDPHRFDGDFDGIGCESGG